MFLNLDYNVITVGGRERRQRQEEGLEEQKELSEEVFYEEQEEAGLSDGQRSRRQALRSVREAQGGERSCGIERAARECVKRGGRRNGLCLAGVLHDPPHLAAVCDVSRRDRRS